MDKYLQFCATLAVASLLAACGDDTYNYTLPDAPTPEATPVPVISKPTPEPPAPTPEPPAPRCKKDHRDCEDSDD